MKDERIKVVHFSESGWVEMLSANVEEVSFAEEKSYYENLGYSIREFPGILFIDSEMVFELFVDVSLLKEEMREEIRKYEDCEWEELGIYKDWVRDEETFETEEEDKEVHWYNKLGSFCEDLLEKIKEDLKLDI